MAEQDSSTQDGRTQEPTPYVTAEMAWEMSKRAAAEAREEALKEFQSRTQSNVGTQTQTSVPNDGDRYRDRYGDGYGDRYRDRDNDYDDRRSRKRRRRDDDEEEEEDLVGFSPKLVKQLQTTVGVFNTLKDFASNPMQKAIEDRIGGLAAGIIEQAFTSPRGPPPRRDMVDTLLNSQMAFGLGQGLGSRAPELVESLSKSFGREKAENMIEGMIGKYSSGEQKKIESGDRAASPGPSRPASDTSKSEDSNIELLLSLDPNNPEHVAAYAESQGGVSIDVARKMLMIHQDDIIKRMKSQGADTTVIEAQRGSRIGQDNPARHRVNDQDTTHTPESRSQTRKEDIYPDRTTSPYDRQESVDVQMPPPVQVSSPGQQVPYSDHRPSTNVQMPPPVQVSSPGQQTSSPNYQSRTNVEAQPPTQASSPIQEHMTQAPSHIGNANSQEDMQYDDSINEDIFRDSQKPNQEYAEYRNVSQQDKDANPNTPNNQQIEIMKTFAEDIGKVMGDVISKIENINNTVFNLQNELSEVKKQKLQESQNHELEQKRMQELLEQKRTQKLGQEHTQELGQEHTQELGQEHTQELTISKDLTYDHFEGLPVNKISTEDISETRDIKEPKPEIQDTRYFFPEKVQNIHDFERELEEETKRASQLIKQKTTSETPQTDTKDKKVEITKKPIISIVKKKKVRYIPRQNENDIQHQSADNISHKKDNDDHEDRNNGENINKKDNGNINDVDNNETNIQHEIE